MADPPKILNYATGKKKTTRQTFLFVISAVLNGGGLLFGLIALIAAGVDFSKLVFGVHSASYNAECRREGAAFVLIGTVLVFSCGRRLMRWYRSYKSADL